MNNVRECLFLSKHTLLLKNWIKSAGIDSASFFIKNFPLELFFEKPIVINELTKRVFNPDKIGPNLEILEKGTVLKYHKNEACWNSCHITEPIKNEIVDRF